MDERTIVIIYSFIIVVLFFLLMLADNYIRQQQLREAKEKKEAKKAKLNAELDYNMLSSRYMAVKAENERLKSEIALTDELLRQTKIERLEAVK